MILALAAAAAIAVAPLSAAVSAQAKAAEKIDGAWDMTVTGPDGSPTTANTPTARSCSASRSTVRKGR